MHNLLTIKLLFTLLFIITYNIDYIIRRVLCYQISYLGTEEPIEEPTEDLQARNRAAMIVEAAKPQIRLKVGDRFPYQSVDYDAKSEFIAQEMKPTVEAQFGKSNEVPTRSQLEDIIDSTFKKHSDDEIKEGTDKIMQRDLSATQEAFKQGSIEDKEAILDRETIPIVTNIARNILTGMDASGIGAPLIGASAEPDDVVVASEVIHKKVKAEEYKKWTDLENKPDNEELTHSITEIGGNISKSDLEEAIFSQANDDKRADILVRDSQNIVSDSVERKLSLRSETSTDPQPPPVPMRILAPAEAIVNERLRETYKKDFGTADRKPSNDTLTEYVESAVGSFSTSELLPAVAENDSEGENILKTIQYSLY